MKRSLLIGIWLFLIALPFTLSAQNGGQADSNSVAKIRFLNYENGHYLVAITSNTDCSMTGVVRINSEQSKKFDVGNISGHETDTLSFQALAGATKITFKPDNSDCLCGNVGLLEICVGGILPVKWSDELSAKQTGKQLLVTWTSETESNNDHFLIETSLDGIHFEKIAEVKSKAINGNSSLPISYSISLNLGEKMALGFFSLGFLGLIVANPKRKKVRRLIPILISLGVVTLLFSACQKDKEALIETTDQAQFVRIAQIDKDGNSSYSKVIKIIK